MITDEQIEILAGLTTSEANQLLNIDSATISTAQWGYLGAMNQGVATTDNVTFGNIAGTLTTAAQTNITSLGTLTGLTVNSSTINLSQDTDFVLSGGINGLSIDGTTFSVDGSNNRVGIGTADPDFLFQVENRGTGGVTAEQNIYAGQIASGSSGNVAKLSFTTVGGGGGGVTASIRQFTNSGSFDLELTASSGKVIVTDDFAVDTDTFYVDASADNVILGDTSGNAESFEIHSAAVDASDAAAVTNYSQQIFVNDGADGEECGMAFTMFTSGAQGATATPGGAITFERTGSHSQGKLHLKTKQGTGASDSCITALTLEETGSVTVGTAAIATTATDGFFYIPTCAGTPTGTPTALTGRAPMVYDSTGNKFWMYDGGWIGVALA